MDNLTWSWVLFWHISIFVSFSPTILPMEPFYSHFISNFVVMSDIFTTVQIIQSTGVVAQSIWKKFTNSPLIRVNLKSGGQSLSPLTWTCKLPLPTPWPSPARPKFSLQPPSHNHPISSRSCKEAQDGNCWPIMWDRPVFRQPKIIQSQRQKHKVVTKLRVLEIKHP